jgi:endogenous inhibitor of DNA gyrase (YacG/DUF329 family)
MSTPVTTSLNAWRAVSQADRVRAHRHGRICAHPDCDTVLSIYNPTKYCSMHVEALSSRRRGQIHPARDVTCEHCGSPFETRNERRRYCSDRCRMAAFARRKRAAQRAELRRRQRETTDTVHSPERRLVGDAA